METLWFILVALMLAAYVILDGFDLGAGAIHLFVARSNLERRAILRAVGPVWDGNEVWLLAAGGTLYFAFPLLYASSFSGFYLPLIMVLWLLMMRGIGIEFRNHVEGALWAQFYDVMFSVSSLLLAVFFGAALGNVIRGVPLNAEGYFFEPLWTNFRVDRNPGILDWYTVLTGVVALVVLAAHGACYIALKTEGELSVRARGLARRLWWGVAGLTVVSLIATLAVRPAMLDNYRNYAAGAVFPLAVFASLALMAYYLSRERDKAAFVSSSVYIGCMLAGAAFGLYPYVLPATTEPAYSLTVHNTKAAAHGLSVGIVWWILGMVLALGYFTFLYRLFRGKVKVSAEGHGY
ncbi:MAG: cytochrome d ubiquinol oxidase subunit II [Bryobacterales bacterium]|nr:cytochrome d ubiquinol oxidase subunit II [Bryobacterales bacterium]